MKLISNNFEYGEIGFQYLGLFLYIDYNFLYTYLR